MNERMLELYRQAQVPHTAIDPSNNMPYETTTFSAEKFAELIVFDAIAKIESVGFKSSNDIPFEITDLFVSQIKQHFGVK